jgi:hypothetical protein
VIAALVVLALFHRIEWRIWGYPQGRTRLRDSPYGAASADQGGMTMRVTLEPAADDVLLALPDDVHERALGLIDSAADAPQDAASVFGSWWRATYETRHDELVVLDVGWVG